MKHKLIISKTTVWAILFNIIRDLFCFS